MRLLLIVFLTLNLLYAKKIALLIGNSDYAKKTLSNPTNDIDLLAKKLSDTKIGFTVYKRPNLSKSQMIDALRAFYGKIDGNTIALIYFSGHGVHSTLDGKNYLIPIGGFRTLLNESQLSDVAVSDAYLLGSTNGAKFSILLLDACRSNDFEQSRGGDKGLGQPPSGLKNDYLISYATDVGKTANDGYSNSPYALALSHHLLEDVSIEEVFREVRKEVSSKTYGKQKPLYKPAFNERLCLTGSCGQKVVQVVNDEENQKLRAKIAMLERQQNRAVLKPVRQETRRVDSSTNNMQGITQMNGIMYQNQPFSSQDKSNYDNHKNGGRVWDWQGAKNYCRGLTLGGYSDWRLPNREELQAVGNIAFYHSYGDYKTFDEWKAQHLSKAQKYFHANKHQRNSSSKGHKYFVKKAFVENMPPLTGKYKSATFWSSTERDSSYAWYVGFGSGYDGWYSKTGNYYALCVR